MWRDFNFLRLTDRQTDGQNRLLNPASRMRARGNKNCMSTDSCMTIFPMPIQWSAWLLMKYQSESAGLYSSLATNLLQALQWRIQKILEGSSFGGPALPRGACSPQKIQVWKYGCSNLGLRCNLAHS